MLSGYQRSLNVKMALESSNADKNWMWIGSELYGVFFFNFIGFIRSIGVRHRRIEKPYD